MCNLVIIIAKVLVNPIYLKGAPMERAILKDLIAWKKSPVRSPLVLCGARQVGKTYTLKDFGSRFYSTCAYINLMSPDAKALFAPGYNAKQVLSDIGIYTHTKIVPGETLVILDEIQEVPEAISLIKDFKESLPEQHVVAAGSYLGVAYHAGVSFPVGKVDLLDMYPLSFLEFLRALGEEELAQTVSDLDLNTASRFSNRLDRLLRSYYFVGGMPEAVSNFVKGGEDYGAARTVQSSLLTEYDRDFSKHITNSRAVERTRLAYDSIPTHLGRENHKFVFGHITRGARAREYEIAIQLIVDSGLATRVYRVDKPMAPLRFYRDLSSFKLYLHDVGLLGCAMEISAADVLLSNKGLEEYKGALTEQYVCQQLVSSGVTPYYWSASSGTAEVDFVMRYGNAIAPLEVKAEENLNAKSLRLLCQETGLHGYRTSMSGFREQDWLTNVPLWAVGAYFGNGR